MILNKSDINRITAVHSLGFHNFSGPESGEFVFYDGKTPPTEEAIQAEIVRLKEEYDAQEYARTRATEYPALAEQLDLLYHDMTAGKGTKAGNWYKAVKKVKTDNPKG